MSRFEIGTTVAEGQKYEIGTDPSDRDLEHVAELLLPSLETGTKSVRNRYAYRPGSRSVRGTDGLIRPYRVFRTAHVEFEKRDRYENSYRFGGAEC